MYQSPVSQEETLKKEQLMAELKRLQAREVVVKQALRQIIYKLETGR
jgi:hypothetical protein